MDQDKTVPELDAFALLVSISERLKRVELYVAELTGRKGKVSSRIERRDSKEG